MSQNNTKLNKLPVIEMDDGKPLQALVIENNNNLRLLSNRRLTSDTPLGV